MTLRSRDRETEIKVERWRDREIARQVGREIERQIDRQRYRGIESCEETL